MAEGTAPAKEKKKAPPRASIKGVNISPGVRVSLYSQAKYLPQEFRDNSGLRLPFVTYFQDPWVAAAKPEMGFDEETMVDWEPGLTDGPTSSRFAVVDFNGDTGKVNPPAVWNEQLQTFTAADGTSLTKNAKDHPSFHQVNVWVLLQRALAFFEDGSALGRRIPWAFEGNRLIVVPHAGFAENAFYDRESKSLQFYFFGSTEKPVFTCLSTDIVCHEFAHAVLDGVRPLFNESISPETAAFHEFTGDISAILLTLRNNSMRRLEADETKGDLGKADSFAQIAEEFGQALDGHPYLRTGRNKHTMQSLAGEREPHRLSEVLTGAMYDVLLRLGEHYSEEEVGKKPKSPRQIFWAVADRMPRMAIQPLDLLPPVEVSFHDYALAVCRSQQLSDPMDPNGYYAMLLEVFVKRGIMSAAEAVEMKQPRYLNERMQLSVRHSVDDISRSRAAAYRFLDDNREDLLIPANRDFFVADLYDAKKRSRQNMAMPRQIVLQYVWREEVKLDGARFGKFNGRTTSMLCGGTLVFDEIGNALHWAMKPGALPYGGKRERGGKVARMWDKAVVEGTARRAKMLDDIAAQLAAGRVGSIAGTPKGMLGSAPPVLVDELENEEVRFTLPPHMGLSLKEEEETGERQWQISC
ncbi:MAG: serine protease [Acidobacteria bacterium]|nr:serine protease [Acidobacteriota bacterium]